jgi:L-lactate dehydrogenase (cytochrome)/(S)-mandelate dehydrogenase
MNVAGFDLRLRTPDTKVSVADYRRAARRRVPRFVWAYVDEGADDLETVKDNEAAFDRWSFKPRALTGVGDADLSTTVAGVKLAMPLMLAPTGFSGLTRWRGDIDSSLAAEACGTRAILSTASSWSLEEVAEACAEPPFFQLYPRDGDTASKLMTRAWNVGYRALYVTVDVPVVGNRRMEQRRGMGLPPVLTPARALDLLRHPVWSFNVLRHGRIGGRTLATNSSMAAALEAVAEQQREITQARMSWDDIAWMRDKWKGHFSIKGLTEPEDAEKAVGIGADGIVVSNHGGRQLDFASGSLDALPDIVSAVGGRAEILLDGGVRRGGDVVKAVALGARAVLVGRPYLYGLAVDGRRGVEAILGILRREMAGTMRLLGAHSMAQLDASWVKPRAGHH